MAHTISSNGNRRVAGNRFLRGAADGTSSLLTEDILLPSQFADLRGASRDLNEHQRLRLAILEEAVEDLRRTARVRPSGYLVGLHSGSSKTGPAKAKELRDETIAWFESDDASWPGSFRAICDVLPGIDGDAILRALRACDWKPAASVGARNQLPKRRRVSANRRRHDKRPWQERQGKRWDRQLKTVPKDFWTHGSSEGVVAEMLGGDAA